MMEIFEILRHPETSSSTSTSRGSPILETAVRDRIFKTVILAFLLLSIMIQILVSASFHDKLKILENRLSLYPLTKPVEIDLAVALPELVEVDRKIHMLIQLLDKGPKTQRAFSAPEGNTGAEILSTPVQKKAEPRRSSQVEVVEKVKN